MCAATLRQASISRLPSLSTRSLMELVYPPTCLGQSSVGQSSFLERESLYRGSLEKCPIRSNHSVEDTMDSFTGNSTAKTSSSVSVPVRARNRIPGMLDQCLC